MVFFFLGKICHFAIEKNSQLTLVKRTFWKFKKKLSHLKEEYYEIATFFEGFGQMSSFALLKLACLANIVLVVCQHLRGFLDLAKSSCD